MKRTLLTGLLVLGALGTAGCDTDQPAQGGPQDAILQINATGGTVEGFFTWALYEDSDLDSVPDDVNSDGMITEGIDETLWCMFGGGLTPPSVPWQFSLKVSLLPAGETVPVLLSSTDALSDDFSRAPYDDPSPEPTHVVSDLQEGPFPVTHARGTCSGNGAIKCNPAANTNVCGRYAAGACVAAMPMAIETRWFVFDNTQKFILSGANSRLLAATGNVIHDACAGTNNTIQCNGLPVEVTANVPFLGFCPGNLVGDAAIDPGNPLASGSTFGVTLERGDTLIVEARRADQLPGGNIVFGEEPRIAAQLTVNGKQLAVTEVVGNLEGTAAPDSYVSFSYTSQ